MRGIPLVRGFLKECGWKVKTVILVEIFWPCRAKTLSDTGDKKLLP